MRRFWLMGGLATVLVAAPVRAQDVPEPARAAELRAMIEERFAERLVQQLRLTPEQASQLRATLTTWAGKRRELERSERSLRQHLNSQMRPGVAADEADVSRTVAAILDGRIAYVQTFKDELADLSAMLTPVQQAQYLLLRDRLNQRVQDVRNRRSGGRRVPRG